MEAWVWDLGASSFWLQSRRWNVSVFLRLDSIEIDEPLLDRIAGEPRLMPHFHLSLQAGDDMILKR